MWVTVQLASKIDIRTAIAEVLKKTYEPFAMTEERGFVLRLVLSELLANAFEHAGGTVHFTYDISDGYVKACICDEGEGFDCCKEAVLPPPESESGRGIFLAKELSDELRYNEKGNAVYIKISLT